MTTDSVVLELPGYMVGGPGPMEVHNLVSDFTGTISVDGDLVPGVAERLEELARRDVRIYYMTADTHGKVHEALANSPVEILKVTVGDEKPDKIREIGFDMNHTVVMGNGKNDLEMFKIAHVGVAVMEGEGLNGGLLGMAIEFKWPVVRNALDALDLLLLPKRFQATTRD